MTAFFVVTSGNYNDYHIVDVCSTEEKANRLAAKCKGSVEGFEIDRYPELLPWRVNVSHDGEVVDVHLISDDDLVFSFAAGYLNTWVRCERKDCLTFDGGDSVYVYVFAQDKYHAVSIAMNEWAQRRETGCSY